MKVCFPWSENNSQRILAGQVWSAARNLGREEALADERRGAQLGLQERRDVEIGHLPCVALGHDRKHLVAALGLPDDLRRNNSHEVAGGRAEDVVVPGCILINRNKGPQRGNIVIDQFALVGPAVFGQESSANVIRKVLRARPDGCCLPIDDDHFRVNTKEHVVEAIIAVDEGWRKLERVGAGNRVLT